MPADLTITRERNTWRAHVGRKLVATMVLGAREHVTLESSLADGPLLDRVRAELESAVRAERARRGREAPRCER